MKKFILPNDTEYEADILYQGTIAVTKNDEFDKDKRTFEWKGSLKGCNALVVSARGLKIILDPSNEIKEKQ